jgi:hypothetical protein
MKAILSSLLCREDPAEGTHPGKRLCHSPYAQSTHFAATFTEFHRRVAIFAAGPARSLEPGATAA